jgi:hypothetical protein
MTNINLLNNLINSYNKLSYTHNYIFGFNFKGNLYAVVTTSEVLPYVLTLDSASRGAGYALRFNPTNEQKVLLLSKGAELICSTKFFLEIVENSKYNKGEIFEKLCTENVGQKWEKDNVPFTDGGDLTVDGIAYQIKFEKATFTNEKTLARLSK